MKFNFFRWDTFLGSVFFLFMGITSLIAAYQNMCIPSLIAAYQNPKLVLWIVPLVIGACCILLMVYFLFCEFLGWLEITENCGVITVRVFACKGWKLFEKTSKDGDFAIQRCAFDLAIHLYFRDASTGTIEAVPCTLSQRDESRIENLLKPESSKG